MNKPNQPAAATTKKVITISASTPYVNTYRAAARAAKTAGVVVWQRPSDGMVTYVWCEGGRVRRRQRGRVSVKIAGAARVR